MVIMPTILPVISESINTGTIKKLISGRLNKYFDKNACDKLLTSDPAKLIPKIENTFLK